MQRKASPHPHPCGGKKKNHMRKRKRSGALSLPLPSPPRACFPKPPLRHFLKPASSARLSRGNPAIPSSAVPPLSPSFGPRHLPCALLAPATGLLWLDAPTVRKKGCGDCAPHSPGWRWLLLRGRGSWQHSPRSLSGSDSAWKPPGGARDSVEWALRPWGSRSRFPLPPGLEHRPMRGCTALLGSASSH